MPSEGIGVENVLGDEWLRSRHEIAIGGGLSALRFELPAGFRGFLDLGSGTRPIAGVRPEAGQVRVGLPAQESHGVFEIGVEQIVVIDEGGDRRIAVHRSAEIVQRERDRPAVRAKAARTRRRRAAAGRQGP